MTQAVRKTLSTAFRTMPSGSRPTAPVDPVAELSTALGTGWKIEQQTDYMGEVAVVILPFEDDDTKPTFILYQKAGLARVGTVREDVWQGDRSFTTLNRALAAIIAAATEQPR